MIPRALRNWFVIHFALDWLIAIPLMIAPTATLKLFGWEFVDPVATRLVSAALLAIGGESLRMRHASAESYRLMLDLKLIWSSGAMFGLAWSGFSGGPAAVWLFFGLFAIFFLVWWFFRRKLSSIL
jgi:hypothetical protein